MPANLPPQYFETERKLRTAKTPQEKMGILEELLAIVPKHKGTEKLQALLKTKIAKLKSSACLRPAIARHGPSYLIEKSGAGQVIVIGPPNAGKSMLIKALSGANPEIGEYPYTTHIPSPYMMKYENVQIQLIDTPPITPDCIETWLPEMIKLADGVLFVLDPGSEGTETLFEALLLKLREKKIELVSENSDIPAEKQLLLKRTLIVANKMDESPAAENVNNLRILFEGQFEILPISAWRGDGLKELRMKIFSLLQIIRVYSKAPGKKIDYDEPFTLKKGSSVLDMARAVHKDFVEKLKYAKIWSKNKYQGQMVNRDHILEDEDVIELHI